MASANIIPRVTKMRALVARILTMAVTSGIGEETGQCQFHAA
jgi:hypothetical protein